MNLEEKRTRLKELEQIEYPSDQEIDEAIKLEEEIKLMETDQSLPEYSPKDSPKLAKLSKETVQPNEKRKRTIYQYLKEKFGEKPATWDEIQQLKLNAVRARLQKDIAISKAKKRELKMQRFKDILGMVGLQGTSTTQSQPKKKTKGKNLKDEEGDDFTELLGTNKDEKYKGLI